MFELIYKSTAKPDISSTDILKILNLSKHFNSFHDITGCLLYFNHEFIQVLEGEEIEVKKLYSRIEKDKRHSNVVLIKQGNKSLRTFKNWSMAYHELKKSEINDLHQKHFIDSFLTISKLSEKPTDVVKLFWQLSQQMLKS